MSFNLASYVRFLPQAVAIYYAQAASFNVFGKYHVVVTLNGSPHHLTIGEAIDVLIMVSSGIQGAFQVGDVNVVASLISST